MKEIINVILAIIVFGSCFPTAVCAAEQVQVDYVIKEDFNSMSAGNAPTGLSVINKSNRIEVEEIPTKENKSVKYTIDQMSDSYIDLSLGSLTGNVIFEFDVMYEREGEATLAIFFRDTQNKEFELMHITDSLVLTSPRGQQIQNCNIGKFYRICAVINTESGMADLYVDHKKRAENMVISDKPISGISLIRIHAYNLGEGVKPIFYIDNLATYVSDMPIFKLKEAGANVEESKKMFVKEIATDSEVEEYLGDSIALYVGKSKMYTNGEVLDIDADNPNVRAYLKDGRTLIPLRAVSEAFGAEVDWDEAAKTASVEYGDTTVKMMLDSKTFTVNDETKTFDVTPQLSGDRVFLPIRALSEALGKKVTYYKSGLIVIADKENFFDYIKDLGVFRALCGKLVFENPSGEELVKTIKSRYPDNEHPRIHLNKDGMKTLSERIENDELFAQWFKPVRARADEILNESTTTYSIDDGIRLLSASRRAQEIFEVLSFTYQMTGESKYADRCVEEMKSVCSFKDWNPYHFLDTATMMRALAIAYDWIYDYMEPELRETVKNAIRDMGLVQILEDYDNVPRKRTWQWAQSEAPDNWNLVCNGGALVAAMVIADEEPEIAARVFNGGMELIKRGVLMYGPDGAWYEGAGYWLYGTSYFTEFVSSMRNVFNNTYGYMDAPGIKLTGYYINDLMGPEGAFNFHDSPTAHVNSPEMFFFADYLGDGMLADMRMNQMQERNIIPSFRDLIWYNPDLPRTSGKLSKDVYYRDSEVAVMRSNWYDDSSIYIGFHSGRTNVYHGHMDAGSFVLDAYGTRFVNDVGMEDYNIPDSVWNLYRYRAEGHNTLVINPGRDGGQNIGGNAKIDRFESGNNSAYAITDLSEMYSKDASSVKRGIKLTDNRRSVLLQDEIKSENPVDVLWFIHAMKPIEVSEDGRSATIYGDFRNMKLDVLGDVPGAFEILEAEPLPTSPTNSSQTSNLIYKKLTFRCNNVTDATIPVLMRFEFPVEGISELGEKPDVVPLDSWTLDETGAPENPLLNDLKINDETINLFKNDKFEYTYYLKENEGIPQITAEGEGDIKVTLPETSPGYAVVSIAAHGDKSAESIYLVRILEGILHGTPAGTEKYDVKSVVASKTPQPENGAKNTIDGNLETRWSAMGIENLVFDLEAVKPISHIGIAIYQDTTNDGRRQFFEVLASEDGEKYTSIHTGESTGTTLEEEIFAVPATRARYVKVIGKGTTVGEWNSITEFSIYGK